MKTTLALLLLLALLYGFPSEAIGEPQMYFSYHLSTQQLDQKVSELDTYEEIEATVTAYNESDGNTPGVIMANGERVHSGAVASNDFDLGTVVEIQGKTYVVCDRMGKGKPYRFDIYVTSVEAADTWGVQKLKVRVYK